MESSVANQLWLIFTMAAGVGVGFAIHAYYRRKDANSEDFSAILARLTDAVAFLSGAVGVLLGLLLSISVTNFQATQSSLDNYNSTTETVFASVQAYPDPYRTNIRNDVICSAETFWNSKVNPSVHNDGIVDTQTRLWMTQLNRDLAVLPTDTGQQTETYGQLVGNVHGMGALQSELMTNSTQQIPSIIWFVIFSVVFILTVSLTISLADKRRFSLLAIFMTYVCLAVMIFGLSVMEYPLYDGGLGGVVSMEGTEHLVDGLLASYPEASHPVCPVLSPGVSPWG